MTINGAAVHIGKGGNIDKGPKELMGKSEHEGHAAGHRAEAAKHRDSALRKGAHPDASLHRAAAAEHGNAAMAHENAHAAAARGDINAARKHDKDATEYASNAAKHESRLGSGKGPEAMTPSGKPQAHAGLHADAGEDVKGSEKHEAEHKRLLKEYDKSSKHWERNAINNLIAKNADEGSKANAQTKHHKALQLSQHAKNTDNPDDHKAARSAIDAAREAHERAGGEGSKAKIKELDAMRKPHHAAAEKADKVSKKGPMKAGSSQYHSAQHAHHTAQAEQAAKAGKPDLEAAHKEAADAHWEASTAIAQGKQGSAGHAMTKAKAAERTVAKHGGNNGPSALAKIAARTAKKVAEEAADQDPKHKK